MRTPAAEMVARTGTDLVQALVCPGCRNDLQRPDAPSDGGFRCLRCRASYPVRKGVPILLPSQLESPDPAEASQDLSHKERQIAFFDQEPPDEFGITRPHGAPALYRWLLEEKFRRSVSGLEPILAGRTALTVCGGSGLDAEFLARAGAHVILSDISLGVVLQAKERARRFQIPMETIVADVENLPFRDRSIDVVYVHDGLHHLEKPAAGLAEMARVARRAVSVSEPAVAALTALAVHLGFALAKEEAGNPVRRLTLDEIVAELELRGFRPLRPHRYAMYYRHEPGRAVRALSKPVALPIAKAGLLALNRIVGRLGNKLTVQAVRSA